jgi:hypothetical protein
MQPILDRVARLEDKLEQALDLLRQRVPGGWGDVAAAGRLLGIGRESLQRQLKDAWIDAGRPARLTPFRLHDIPARWSRYGPSRPVFQVYLPACMARGEPA